MIHLKKKLHQNEKNNNLRNILLQASHFWREKIPPHPPQINLKLRCGKNI